MHCIGSGEIRGKPSIFSRTPTFFHVFRRFSGFPSRRFASLRDRFAAHCRWVVFHLLSALSLCAGFCCALVAVDHPSHFPHCALGWSWVHPLLIHGFWCLNSGFDPKDAWWNLVAIIFSHGNAWTWFVSEFLDGSHLAHSIHSVYHVPRGERVSCNRVWRDGRVRHHCLYIIVCVLPKYCNSQ